VLLKVQAPLLAPQVGYPQAGRGLEAAVTQPIAQCSYTTFYAVCALVASEVELQRQDALDAIGCDTCPLGAIPAAHTA